MDYTAFTRGARDLSVRVINAALKANSPKLS